MDKETKPKKKAISYIYYLFDPRDEIPVYVGKTDYPNKRLTQHKCTPSRNRGKLANWVRSLSKYSIKPEMKVIACALGDWQDIEKQLISQYRSEYSLLNVSSGGNQPDLNNKGDKSKMRRLHQLLGGSLRRGHVGEHTKLKLRLYAIKYPDTFGRYASV